jgi:hypothetical protein
VVSLQEDTQNDTPEKVCLDLYSEDQQFLERHQKDHKTSKLDYSSARAPALNTFSTNTPFEHLDISGPRDKLTDEYCAWQELQVKEPVPKAAYQKAGKGSNIESGAELRSWLGYIAIVK